MSTRKLMWSALAIALAAVACNDPTLAPDAAVAPSFHSSGDGRRAVVVDAAGRHDAATIQAGIALAPAGGRVRVLPGTYPEALVIDKGVTLEGISREGDDDRDGDHGGNDENNAVIIAPSTPPTAVIDVTTTEPVAIRGVTVQGGPIGIRANGIAADLTVERTLVRDFTASAVVGISVTWLAPASGGPASLVVRNSRVEGGAVRPSTGISTQGDVNAVLEDNIVRRSGTRCINVAFGATAVVATTVDVVGNDLDQCGVAGGIVVTANGLKVGTRVANVVGNVIRNSDVELLRNGVYFEGFAGRVEHNSILAVVQAAANPSPENIAGCCFVVPAGIFVGSLRGAAQATPVVRFNDVAGNAFAGLRIGPNQSTSLDARCNYWGSADGPSGVGPGTGDAVLAETGGARPVLAPFATGPFARHRHHGDHDEDDDDRRGGGRCNLEFSLWSAPVPLGAPVNSTAGEQTPALSPDGLSLYFQSNRAGSDGNDLWVSRRASLDSPWEAPVNLGPRVNSAGTEGAPALSSDGHLLFFQSDRPGGQGGGDIYVSQRTDPNDDFGWGPPVNLGPEVNTAAFEGGPGYLTSTANGVAALYFGRGSSGVDQDIYYVPVTADGQPQGPAVLVTELTDPTVGVNDAHPSVRTDGREVILYSNRAGGFGVSDLWVSTRRSVHDPWSRPDNLGAPMNTTFIDTQPTLSQDARTLVFSSNRPGGLGLNDIWISTRTRIGR